MLKEDGCSLFHFAHLLRQSTVRFLRRANDMHSVCVPRPQETSMLAAFNTQKLSVGSRRPCSAVLTSDPKRETIIPSGGSQFCTQLDVDLAFFRIHFHPSS